MSVPEYSTTPRAELEHRIECFQQRLQESHLDGALILQQADKFYFTGTVQDGVVFIPVEGETLFMVRKSHERAKKESPLEHVLPFQRYSELPTFFTDYGYSSLATTHAKIGFEADVMPVLTYQRLQRALPKTEFIDCSPSILQTRMIKSAYEQDQIRRAAEQLREAFGLVTQILSVGMSELEIAALLEAELRLNGHHGTIRVRRWNQECFYGLVLGGETGSVANYMDAPLGGKGTCPALPRGASTRKIKRGEPLIIDLVGGWMGYVADMTRTFSVGPLPHEILEGYRWCVALEEQLIERLEEGLTLSEVYKFALDEAASAGHAERFMGYGKNQARFIGHGIGLELDELPVIARHWGSPLKPGQCFALEPKLVYPGKGAVGIENTWGVIEDGGGALKVERMTTAEEYI